ncbi:MULTISPECIES: cobyrinic acid a,c-diamide synthase [unclassified Halomonas]|uniref:cobyrinic acid a,c-diamide synthase n=1 Tax=unclassified Halomonas TaxID=2609666 RepID=UPI001CF20C77|nr:MULTISPECIES: cobyrinic acid a,c-diamide synthase [unclassified Halomonas]MCA8865288.1 cobyrinic acid a,c-diamide synthase [Halomonas sp. SBBP1]UZH12247.1 cobyrinic acid a,c-diamide synthase [Halomonas sp. BDJS001]
MLGFLQGFSYGLFMTCLPWLLVGLFNPGLAVPVMAPSRLQVIARYCLVVPSISMLLWLTSLWGGFSPSLFGWLTGLVAIPVALPAERTLRGWLSRRRQRRHEAQREAEAQRRRAQEERNAFEAGVLVLDPARPPEGANDLVLAMCRVKQRLLDVQRPDLAILSDRLYSRYRHVMDVLGERFHTGELAFERSQGLVTQVCFGAVDTLTTMASQARGVVSVDGNYVRSRLEREGKRLSDEERAALVRRLDLLVETEHSLNKLSARIESALTVLDDTAVSMARIETARPQASVTTEKALEDLRLFVEGAERYARKE